MSLERKLARELLERGETLIALLEGAGSSDAAQTPALAGGLVRPSQRDSQATRGGSLSWLKSLLRELEWAVEWVLKELEDRPRATLHLSVNGEPFMNYQLTQGDSVVVALTVTDDTTGQPATLDAGSVTATLSSTSDTVTVDPAGASVTITAGTTAGVGDTVTVNGTVGGVAAKPFVGTYDVVAVVPDSFTIQGTFGTETAPAAPAAAPAPAVVVPAGFSVHPETGEVLDANGNPPPVAV